MRFARNIGIGIELRYFVVILVTAIVVSCGRSNSPVEMNEWNYKTIHTESLQRLNPDGLPVGLVQRLQEDYRRRPVDPSYAELELSSAFLDPSRSAKVLVFDIRYVEDIQAVYIVGADDDIEARFLLSVW
jgi:hypothetical protein